MTLPCPVCRASSPVAEWFDRLERCWPYRRFVETRCPRCAAQAVLMPGWDSVAIGLVDKDKDPVLVPAGRLDLDGEDYTVSWSSNGVRVSLDERKWTAVAAEGDRGD